MEPIQSHFTTDDGLRIHTVQWMPYGGHKAIVLVVHGIHEHSGRYQHVVDFLIGHGYAVFSYDQRGHGRSEGARAYFRSMDQLVADLQKYFEAILAQHGEIPIFVFGHSMGALVSLLFTLKNQSRLTGFMTSGLPINIDEHGFAPTTTIRAMQVGRLLIPKMPLFFMPLNSNNATRDPGMRASALADPLVHHKAIKLNSVVELAVGGRRVRPEIPKLDLPLLIMHGGGDKISPVSGSQYLYEHAAAKDKTLKIYDGFYHEVHNEPERETVLLDMVTWLDAHSEPAHE